MPASMEVTNAMVGVDNRTSETTAGPGQYPIAPQPSPKSAAPASNGPSMDDRVVNPKALLRTGLRAVRAHETAPT